MTSNVSSNMRASNMELLRIVSMLLVVLVHVDGASLGLPFINGNLSDLTARDCWRLAVESISIIGVNCFTLISGYFGIKLRWKGIASFFFQCVFYSVLIASFAPLLLGKAFSWTIWGESWLVLSHTDLWYVPAYFCLMLLSPFLNAGVDRLSFRQFTVILSVFILFNLWSGWWWGAKFNPTGYTVIQLVMMYLTGRWIAEAVDRWPLLCDRWISGIAYIFATGMIFLSSLYLEPVKAYAYNAPAVVLASVAFFMFFRSLKFSSPLVNGIARSAFAVYLIHKAPEIWGDFMRPEIVNLWTSMSLPAFTVAALLIPLLTYLIAIPLDAFRRYLWDTLSSK